MLVTCDLKPSRIARRVSEALPVQTRHAEAREVGPKGHLGVLLSTAGLRTLLKLSLARCRQNGRILLRHVLLKDLSVVS